jgi:acyl-CoA oxidase
MLLLLLQGSEEQKSSLLPGMASKDLAGCWALTEPSNGSDASSLTCRCVFLDGCGHTIAALGSIA